MMLNLMERFPLGEYGFQSPRAMHVMIEAKKLAYADLIRYVGDPRASARAGRRDAQQGACGRARPADRPGEGGVRGRAVGAALDHQLPGQRHHLPDHGRSRRQHGVAHPEQLQRLRIGRRARGRGLHAAQPRRAVHARGRTSRTRWRRASARSTRSSRASWKRTGRASASASWAAGTRRRRTRSSSPTSPTSG